MFVYIYKSYNVKIDYLVVIIILLHSAAIMKYNSQIFLTTVTIGHNKYITCNKSLNNVFKQLDKLCNRYKNGIIILRCSTIIYGKYFNERVIFTGSLHLSSRDKKINELNKWHDFVIKYKTYPYWPDDKLYISFNIEIPNFSVINHVQLNDCAQSNIIIRTSIGEYLKQITIKIDGGIVLIQTFIFKSYYETILELMFRPWVYKEDSVYSPIRKTIWRYY